MRARRPRRSIYYGRHGTLLNIFENIRGLRSKSTICAQHSYSSTLDLLRMIQQFSGSVRRLGRSRPRIHCTADISSWRRRRPTWTGPSRRWSQSRSTGSRGRPEECCALSGWRCFRSGGPWERGHRVVRFSRNVTVYFCQTTHQICFGPDARFVP